MLPHNMSPVAPAVEDSFRDINVITARAEYVNLAYLAAADLVYKEGIPLTEHTVHAVAVAIINDRKIEVREHVSVQGGTITVCADVGSVNEAGVETLAIQRVANALEQLNGSDGVVTYGQTLVYTLSDVSELMPGVSRAC